MNSNAPATELASAYERALRLFRQGNLTSAREIIVCSKAPLCSATAPLYELLAIIDRREGRIESAIEIWHALLCAGVVNAGVYNNLANCYRSDGRAEQAEKYYRDALQCDPGHEDSCINLALLWREQGAFMQADHLLQATFAGSNLGVRVLHMMSLVRRDLDDLAGALRFINKALEADADNHQLLHLKARLMAESGQQSIDSYRLATSMAPDDDEIFLGYCVALVESGQRDEGFEQLAKRLARKPLWLKGHAALSQLTWQYGSEAEYLQSYRRALVAEPSNTNLWADYFTTLMRSERYADVLRQLPEARRRCGQHLVFDRFEACCASEGGDLATATRLFDRLDPLADHGIAVAAIRHLVRCQLLEEATLLAESLAKQGLMSAWSYLTLLWRALGDSRLRWLEDIENCVRVTSVDLGSEQLRSLAESIRRCHTATRHPYDQSMRDGTQTDGNLLNRTHPSMGVLKSALLSKLDSYTKSLRPKGRAHPFYRWSGSNASMLASYSVLLKSGGFHVSHMHPHTWISCCLYLDVPDSISVDSSRPEGWFALGKPPSGLGLELPPTMVVKPERGKLVIFPSFLWHGTIPFTDGERLSVVCDLIAKNEN